MTKRELKQLSRLVKDLPEMKSKTLKVQRAVKGSTLIASGKTENGDGEKINPDKYYLIDTPKVINHRTEAEKYFRAHSMKGVEDYRAMILKRNADAHDELNERVKQIDDAIKGS